ncbi:MAG: acyl-ACP desaturase [Acidimicrobiales bacterium]
MPEPDRRLILDLAPEAARLLERHLGTAKEWFPHELVSACSPEPPETGTPEVARRALLVNLLTEDNLPYYFRAIDVLFGDSDAWGTWNRRWTAEEGRHSIVIRDYVTKTGLVDPVELERARMAQVCQGFFPRLDGPAEGLVYVALQELATRIAHRNTGKLLPPDGAAVMARVAADENLHHLFYRDLVTAAIEVSRSALVLAIDAQVRRFEMPGSEIRDFRSHALAMARAGIYDLAIHHDQILVPIVLRHWRLEALTGLSPEAERARDRTLLHMSRLKRAARRFSARREELVGA